jgi:hypothetical protein
MTAMPTPASARQHVRRTRKNLHNTSAAAMPAGDERANTSPTDANKANEEHANASTSTMTTGTTNTPTPTPVPTPSNAAVTTTGHRFVPGVNEIFHEIGQHRVLKMSAQCRPFFFLYCSIVDNRFTIYFTLKNTCVKSDLQKREGAGSTSGQ